MNTRLERIGQVAEILTRHGLGFLVGATGIEKWHLGATSGPATSSSSPERLRHALEELGPVFIKLGQMLSTRPDVVPTEYQVELSRLQDGAPPVSSEVIQALIRQELGADAR
nr:AarF/ABC1/UbiB kinase family protein [Acidobacteriota bacterium]